MRMPPVRLNPREATRLFGSACRHIICKAHGRDEFEAQIATARHAFGIPPDFGATQIEGWWGQEQRRRVGCAITTFSQLRAKHTSPATQKTRPARPTFKRAKAK